MKMSICAACAMAISATAHGQFVGTDWTGSAGDVETGNLLGSTVTLTAPSSGPTPSANPGFDLSAADPDFAGAPLSNDEEMVSYGFDSNWTATFSASVTDVYLYAKFWRGPNQLDSTDFEYTFDQPFTIVSGFTNSFITGNTLTVPVDQFQDGILLFSGSIASVGVISNTADSGSTQALTFGTVPSPGAAAVFGLAGLAATRRRR